MKIKNCLAVTTRPPETLPESQRVDIDNRALAEAWAADLCARAEAGTLATRTAETYPANLERWLSWLDAEGVKLPTPAHVLRFITALRAAGLKPASIQAHLAAVRGLYRWAESRNIYPAIARSVQGPRVRKDEALDCLGRAEVAALLKYTDGETVRALRDRALVHVMFSTGLRLISLTAANVADLDTGDCVLSYAGKGDNSKARRAFLAPGAVDALRAYLEARRNTEGKLEGPAPLFAAVGNRSGGSRLTARSVRRVIIGLMERAGHVTRDAGKITKPGIFSAHSIRRSAITAAYDAAGLDAAQTLAGHADPGTTRRCYARIQKGRVLRELAAVLDLGKGDE